MIYFLCPSFLPSFSSIPFPMASHIKHLPSVSVCYDSTFFQFISIETVYIFALIIPLKNKTKQDKNNKTNKQKKTLHCPLIEEKLTKNMYKSNLEFPFKF